MSYSVDQNQKSIVDTLKANGNQVIAMASVGGGFPDLLVVHKETHVVLIEVKFGRDAVITKPQMTFIGNYKGYIGFAENEAQALDLAKDPVVFSLSQNDKNKIAVFALKFTKKAMRFTSFKKEILGR